MELPMDFIQLSWTLPYGIFEKERKNEMYGNLYNMLFPSKTHPVEIYSWDTDWSNYFDAGKEWWAVICGQFSQIMVNLLQLLEYRKQTKGAR